MPSHPGPTTCTEPAWDGSKAVMYAPSEGGSTSKPTKLSKQRLSAVLLLAKVPAVHYVYPCHLLLASPDWRLPREQSGQTS